MQGLSKEHYEAASIDGANSFQLFTHITLPGIKPVLFIVIALETISAINAFDMIFIMTGGGPAGTTETLGLFVYHLAFGGGFEFGPASAVSVVMILLALIGFLIYAPTQKLNRKRKVM
jgi:multiple sugar transport system permease protein